MMVYDLSDSESFDAINNYWLREIPWVSGDVLHLSTNCYSFCIIGRA